MSKQNDELKRRVYAIFQPIPVGDARIVAARHGDASTATRVRFFLMALIWLLVFAVILASYPDVYQRYHTLFNAVFAFAIVVFTIELLLRVWSCTVDPRFRGPIKGRLKCLFTTSLLVNLLVIVPFYAKPFFPGADVFINAAIILIILKLLTYSSVFNFVIDVLKAKKNELVTALAIDVILLITFSSFMFIIMHASDPSGFSSIPAAGWWAAQTSDLRRLRRSGAYDRARAIPGSFCNVLGHRHFCYTDCHYRCWIHRGIRSTTERTTASHRPM